MTTANYSSLGKTFQVSFNLQDIANRDKINLLHQLLCEFDFQPGEADYEGYQAACQTVLDAANRYWDIRRAG